MTKKTLKVVYRALKGEVAALLPELPAKRGYIACYAHIGQHSECSSFITSIGRLATLKNIKPFIKSKDIVYIAVKVLCSWSKATRQDIQRTN